MSVFDRCWCRVVMVSGRCGLKLSRNSVLSDMMCCVWLVGVVLKFGVVSSVVWLLMVVSFLLEISMMLGVVVVSVLVVSGL